MVLGTGEAVITYGVGMCSTSGTNGTVETTIGVNSTFGAGAGVVHTGSYGMYEDGI